MARSSSDRVMRARILLGAIRARRTSAIANFAVAVVAIAAGAIGPMFLESADRSVLASTIGAAPPGAASLTAIANGGASEMRALASSAQAAVALAHGQLATPRFTADVGTHFIAEENQEFATDVLARTDLCANVRLVAGSCPTRTGEVAISKRSAQASGERVGGRIDLTEPHTATLTTVSVVGIYLQAPSVATPYSAGIDYFGYGSNAGSSSVTTLDPLIASFATALSTRAVATPQLEVDLDWRTAGAVAGAGAIRTTATAVTSLFLARNGVVATTPIDTILDTASHDENLSGGQRLRVAIARALATGAPFVVMDEPTAELDAANRDLVLSLIAAAHARGTGFAVVSHDRAVIEVADAVYELPGWQHPTT